MQEYFFTSRQKEEMSKFLRSGKKCQQKRQENAHKLEPN